MRTIFGWNGRLLMVMPHPYGLSLSSRQAHHFYFNLEMIIFGVARGILLEAGVAALGKQVFHQMG